MSSLIISSSNLSINYPSTSTSTSSSTKLCCFGGKFESLNWVHGNNDERRSKRRMIECKNSKVSSLDKAVDSLSSVEVPGFSEPTNSAKIKLLAAVSGLNRGLAATEDDLRKADEAAKELEAAGGPVDLSDDLEKLQGRWKLIYSSFFSSRTLGESRPGPPIRRLLPITLGQVFQRIDVVSKDFDNIVEINLFAPWPFPPAEFTSTLAYKFELQGPAKIKIKFEKTTVKATGNLSQIPPFDIPQIPDNLRPSSIPGSGDFEVTYVDSDIRVTRSDKGELRVFVIS